MLAWYRSTKQVGGRAPRHRQRSSVCSCKPCGSRARSTSLSEQHRSDDAPHDRGNDAGVFLLTMGRVRMPVCLVVGGMADWLLVWRVVFASPWFWIGVDWCADVCPNVASTSLVMSVRVVPQLPTSMFCSYCCCDVRGMQARRDLERLKASYMSKLELCLLYTSPSPRDRG